jgi:hypothetical protein
MDNPKVLRMINHECPRGMSGGGQDGQFGPQSGASKALTPCPGLGHGGTMNGLLAICSICREIIS